MIVHPLAEDLHQRRADLLGRLAGRDHVPGLPLLLAIGGVAGIAVDDLTVGGGDDRGQRLACRQLRAEPLDGLGRGDVLPVTNLRAPQVRERVLRILGVLEVIFLEDPDEDTGDCVMLDALSVRAMSGYPPYCGGGRLLPPG